MTTRHTEFLLLFLLIYTDTSTASHVNKNVRSGSCRCRNITEAYIGHLAKQQPLIYCQTPEIITRKAFGNIFNSPNNAKIPAFSLGDTSYASIESLELDPQWLRSWSLDMVFQPRSITSRHPRTIQPNSLSSTIRRKCFRRQNGSYVGFSRISTQPSTDSVSEMKKWMPQAL